MGELATKIRAKYPGVYDSLADGDLESKVIAKYPGVYDHLAGSEWRQGAGKKAGATQADFIRDEGVPQTLGSRIKEGVKAAMPYVRPVLEGGGATVGGIVGAGSGALSSMGLGTIPGGVAGASLGYAGGAKLSDMIESAVDGNSRPQPATVTGQMGQSLKDLGTGAMFEMGGQVTGKVIGAGVQAASKYVGKTPLKDLAQNRARDVFEANKALTPAESQNAVNAAKLTNKLNVKLTPAQMTGKPSLASMEQGLATADSTFAATLSAQDAKAKQAALDAIRKATGAGKPLPATQDLQTTGANLAEGLQWALKPVKAAERELWGKVPDYPMPSDGATAAIKEITSSPLDDETAAAVQNIVSFYNKTPKTTKGLQAIDQSIGSDIATASMAGKAKIVRALGIIKDGIKNDFDAMGKAAAEGDVALHEGKIVYPSRIQAEIEQAKETIKTAAGMPPTLAEENQHLFKYLAGNKEVVMQNTGITNEQYSKALNDRLKYLQQQGKALDYQPPTGAPNQPMIDNLNQGIVAKQAILDNLQPAKDVAEAYKAAKDFTRDEKFGRFGKGAVKEVLKAGQQSSGLRISDENIARQFFTPSGSDGLIKAVGKGQAKEQMKPFVIADMVKAAAPDGVNFNVQSGINYIQKNRVALEKLGLVDEARTVLKGQIPQEIEKILAKRAPDATGSQFFTAQDMRGILQKYGNTIKQLYGPETLTAFRDYNQLMGMIERKNLIPRSAGSNTAEKAMSVANLMIKEATGPAAKLTDGLLMAIAKGAGLGGGAGIAAGGGSLKTAAVIGTLNAGRQMLKNANNQVAHTFVKILQDATLNPALAHDIMRMQRTGRIPTSLQTIIDNHLITGTAITATSKGANQ